MSILESIKSIVNRQKSEEIHFFDSQILFNAFKQSKVKLPLFLRPFGGGNCASIAVIKAAMEKFGYGVFASILIDEPNERFLVDLRDEEERAYTLPFWALEYAASTTGFVQQDEGKEATEILAFGQFCFAVMAEVKRCEYRRSSRYKKAVTDLNRGDAAEHIYSYLGLNVEEIEPSDQQSLLSSPALVVWNAPHAVYASKGQYDEFFEGYESAEPLSTLPNAHKNGGKAAPIIGAFRVVD